jgi:2-keto-3-deoxy-L-rhamnonate aldolase RhmA
MATRFLDGGGLGIVMPHVDTAEEAREIAQALRYPPHGHRSVAGGLPHFGYERLGLAETCSAINAATLVVVMLETPRAVENAAAIAAVPGIDSLLIGTNDLAMELGILALSATSASPPPIKRPSTRAAPTASSPGSAALPTASCCAAISRLACGSSCRGAI